MWIESEGTLQSDQRQFGPSIWAPFFVPLKKNVIDVLGFYSTRKQTGLSMDCDGSVQTPVNLSALDALERQKGGAETAQSMDGAMVGLGGNGPPNFFFLKYY